MWAQLWDDFDNRARYLQQGGPCRDRVDQTIQWQLSGTTPYVNGVISVDSLHLPEIYSGSPWATCDVPGIAGWIAFIAINPAIDSNEVFPSRADRTQFTEAELVSWFDKRFGSLTSDKPLRHGRAAHVDGPTVWMNPGSRPTPRPQRTWRAIDECIARTIGSAGLKSDAPLGRVGAIVDATPWKFSNWGKVARKTREDLLVRGRPYLKFALETHPPTAVVALGQDPWNALVQAYTTLPDYQPRTLRSGTISLAGESIPVFGVPHPAAHGNAFGVASRELEPALRRALGV